MKALFVTHCNDLSGANKSFLSIVQQLKAKMEIVVLCNNSKGLLKEKLQLEGIEVLTANYSWWYISPRTNPIKQIYRNYVDKKKYNTEWLTSRLVDSLKEYKFDFVYTNTSVIDAGMRISKILCIPHIWHIREFGEEDFGFLPILSKNVYIETFQASEKIIVISDALKEKYLQFIPKEKITRIYNGFEIEKLLGNGKEISNNHPINILITGQVCKGKGQGQAIEAVNKLRKKNYNIELYVAGSVDYSYLNPILDRISNYNDWLHILGNCKDVYSLRNEMNIELVCSRSEAFGRVTLEAMLHGIPVVGSNAGGTRELIKDKETGLLYDVDDIDKLTECISTIINNNLLRNTIRCNAKEFASRFNIKKTAEDVFDVFLESINDEKQ